MAAVLQLVGQGMILLGLVFIAFGVYAVLRLNNFYARLVVTSKVEAMGFTTVTIGAMILVGLDIIAIKLLVILLFELLTVSISAHAIARSAWNSGYHLPPPPPEPPPPPPEPSGD